MFLLLFNTTLFLAVVTAVVALVAWTRPQEWFTSGESGEVEISAPAIPISMPILVRAGGELESAESVEVACEVEGQQLKVVKMLPEGVRVEQNEVVLWIDPSEINDRLAEQEIKLMQADALSKATAEELKIQENLAASTLAQAQLALTLADLDLKKYVEGDYQVQQKDLKGAIALAEADLQESQDTVEHYQMLVTKGFRTPEQLRAKEQAVRRAEYNLSRDQDKLRVLQEFDYKRQTAELEAKSVEAKRELERAKSSSAAAVVKTKTDAEAASKMAALEKGKLDKLKQRLALCQVRAPQDGTVVYAKEKGKRVELGVPVHYKQALFTLPEMSRMQVRAYVHESVLKKVQVGQKAEVRIDAYPNLPLEGHVVAVDDFYDSTRHWLSGGVKEYAARVAIDNLAAPGPQPGMTAEVSIVVDHLKNVLVVPVQGVARHEGRHVCYVLRSDGADRRPVRIGRDTENYVEIIEGLNRGERVALDAHRRAAADADRQDGQAPEADTDLTDSSLPTSDVKTASSSSLSR